MHTVLVLGGYGNFGAYICRALVNDASIRLLVAGRDEGKAQRFAMQIGLKETHGVSLNAEVTTLGRRLKELGVDTLIHTAGPFQGQDYRVAMACIDAGCNYIDLADARDFVAGIGRLDETARGAGVAVVSGASSVPALSAAVVDSLLPEFARLDAIRHGIVSGSKTPGLATVRAVLGYCGKPFHRFEHGHTQTVYGWQGLRRRRYPQPVGWRWLGNCDVPDLELFPRRYPEVKDVIFRAGLGVPFAHLATWALSWLVRWRLLGNLAAWAKPLHWLSRSLQVLGSSASAMHVELSGVGHNGQPLKRTWHIVACKHHGPHIPCGAAIVLARKLARGERLAAGATPCLGLVTLAEYMEALAGLEVRQVLS